MSDRTKRPRLSGPSDESLDDICQPATELDKAHWNGFCEIESEPVRPRFSLVGPSKQLTD